MNYQPNNTSKTKLMNLDQFIKPNIVAIGPLSFYKKLITKKEYFNLDIIFDSNLDILTKVNQDTVAILLDESSLGDNIENKLTNICKEYSAQAVFLLTSKMKNPKFYRYLYEKGVHGVFEWSNDAEIFLELLVESLKPHPHAHGRTRSDDRLAEFVKSHLLTEGQGYSNIDVRAFNGHIFLDGHVTTLAQKDEVKTICEHAPGVHYTNNRNVFVYDPFPVNDHLMKMKITKMTKSFEDKFKAKIILKFKDGHLQLFGRINDEASRTSILDELKKISGIFSIEDKMKIRNPHARKMKQLSYKHVENVVKKYFPV